MEATAARERAAAGAQVDDIVGFRFGWWIEQPDLMEDG